MKVERGDWRRTGLFQISEAEEGRTYRVSFSEKHIGAPIQLRIASEAAESNGPWPIETLIGTESSDNGTWRRHDYQYTVPPDFSNIRFEIKVVAPGTVWIDDVRIEPVD